MLQLADARLHGRAGARPRARRPRPAAGSSTSLRSATPSRRSRRPRRACPCCPSSSPAPDRPRASSTSACADLHPPQNLALLFQVVDGTANPLVVKPDDHIPWTYLRGNEWVPFAADAVADGTDGAARLRHRDARGPRRRDHRPHPAARRAALDPARGGLEERRRVPPAHRRGAGAQARRTPCSDPGADCAAARAPGRHHQQARPARRRRSRASTSPSRPSAAGRSRPTLAFATRVSERLRHKDRAIALWDYEHLVLEAFPVDLPGAVPQPHPVRARRASGTGIYRELAPGHVTVVTIPDLAVPNPRDPLRPFTSLRVLGEIEQFLGAADVLLRPAARAQPAVRGGARRASRAASRRRRRDVPRQPAQAGDHRVPVAVGVPRRRPARPSTARSTSRCWSTSSRSGPTSTTSPTSTCSTGSPAPPPTGPTWTRWSARARSRSSCRCRPTQHGVQPIHSRPSDGVLPSDCALRAGGRRDCRQPSPRPRSTARR